jgi:hypothetical protein
MKTRRSLEPISKVFITQPRNVAKTLNMNAVASLRDHLFLTFEMPSNVRTVVLQDRK